MTGRPTKAAQTSRSGLFSWVLIAAIATCCGLASCAGDPKNHRMVFAHYLLTNQDYQGDTDATQEAKIAAYEKEIRQAQAAGIDGFALNAGGWLRQPRYIRYAAQMFEADVRLKSNFKLMFSADMCCGNTADDVEDMVRRFANNPRYSKVYFKHDGKFVLTTFSGDKMGTSFWQRVKSDLATGANWSTATEPTALAPVRGMPREGPMHVFLVPAFFWGGELPNKSSIELGLAEWSSTVDGVFYWGIAGIPGSGGGLDQISSSENYASVVHGGGKVYIAPVCLQFWGANSDRYYEYGGAAGMRKMWMDAINVSHPDWVEIISWNDFIEGSYVSPIDDPNKYEFANFLDSSGVPNKTVGYFHNHSGAAALLPYFIQWFKSGVEPQITRDSIYWFYRTQSMAFDAGKPAVSEIKRYGPIADLIYVTANLTTSASLTVTSGERVSTVRLPAGSTDVSVPFLVSTTPSFRLSRSGMTIIPATTGADPISSGAQFNDYYYSTGFAIGSGPK